MAEFIGVFVLISFGDGVVAVAVAGLPGSGRTSGPTTIFDAAGDWLLITWGWAMAVAFAIWVAGGVSGAHLNPAVTLAFAVRRRFAWAKVLPYWGAQVLGAFVGAALVYAVYNAAINAFNLAAHTPKSGGQALATYSIFATFPAGYFHGGYGGPLLDQVVGTAATSCTDGSRWSRTSRARSRKPSRSARWRILPPRRFRKPGSRGRRRPT
jgi:glycerol uptake facilitator protein